MKCYLIIALSINLVVLATAQGGSDDSPDYSDYDDSAAGGNIYVIPKYSKRIPNPLYDPCYYGEFIDGQCVCPPVCYTFAYAAVCGSDGRTYENDCFLRNYACRSKKFVKVVHDGECRIKRVSCRNFPCGGSSICVEHWSGTRCVNLHCNLACTLEYDPVCGRDNKTYGNVCLMKQAACLGQKFIRIKHKGECVRPKAY